MKSKPSRQETPSIQSLDRGLAILEAVARSADPVSLGELTELLGIDRSSASALRIPSGAARFSLTFRAGKCISWDPRSGASRINTTGALC